MMIKAIIIDDEWDARDNIEKLLLLIQAPVTVLHKSGSVEDAVQSIDRLNPDLIFLDIHLSTGTGFDVLERIRNKNIHVIFVTSHDTYAIKAFRYAAIHYLLKPIDISDLKEAIQRITEKQESSADENIKIETLIENRSLPDLQKKIVIPQESGNQIVELNEILHLQSDGSYTHFFLKGGKKITSSKTLKYYVEKIHEPFFYRIHKSHFINTNHIILFSKSPDPHVIMANKDRLEIARDKKADFFRVLEESYRK